MITMPQALLDKLPKEAKAIYEAVYKKAKEMGKSDKDAAILAITAVKRKYKQTKEKKWVTKSYALKLNIVKSGLFNSTIKFNVPIKISKYDAEGERILKSTMQDLINRNAINTIGDLDHERIAKLDNKIELRKKLNPYVGTEGLYLLEKLDEDEDGDYIATIAMNKSHPLYKQVLNEHKQGKYLYLSPEWEGARYNADNEIIYADKFGFSITSNPIQSANMINEVIAN
jgi:cation transport regulator ChaB